MDEISLLSQEEIDTIFQEISERLESLDSAKEEEVISTLDGFIEWPGLVAPWETTKIIPLAQNSTSEPIRQKAKELLDKLEEIRTN